MILYENIFLFKYNNNVLNHNIECNNEFVQDKQFFLLEPMYECTYSNQIEDSIIDNNIDHNNRSRNSQSISKNQIFIKNIVEPADAHNVDIRNGLGRSNRVKKIPTFLMDYHHQVNTSFKTKFPQIMSGSLYHLFYTTILYVMYILTISSHSGPKTYQEAS